MAQNLSEYLEEHPCKGFDPVPHYSAAGDYVSYFFRNERCFAQRLDELVTVYLAMDSRELVGCKIKGVRHILETAGKLGVSLDGGDLRLGLLFLPGAVNASEVEHKQRYDELARLTRDAVVKREEVAAVLG